MSSGWRAVADWPARNSCVDRRSVAAALVPDGSPACAKRPKGPGLVVLAAAAVVVVDDDGISFDPYFIIRMIYFRPSSFSVRGQYPSFSFFTTYAPLPRKYKQKFSKILSKEYYRKGLSSISPTKMFDF
jgi:hypothetical protein